MKTLFLSWIGLLCLAANACAQISYVGEVTFPVVDWMLLTAQAPVNTSDPSYDPNLSDYHYIQQETYSYNFDPVARTVLGPIIYPAELKIDSTTPVLQVGLRNRNPIFYFGGTRQLLYTFSPVDQAVENVARLSVAGPYTLAASREGNITLMTLSGGGYTVNPTTGETDLVFGDLGNGDGPGQFSDAHYHAYGPNDLLYVLDYGNDRVQMLDPAKDFDYVGEFALEDGVTTADMQFAIGSNGNIYLGDGQGGGTTYDEDGTYLGAFGLPDSVGGPDFEGVPCLTVDHSGHVYLFDDRGLHEYFDASAVPEPSTWALLILGGAGCLVLARKREKAGV